MTELKGQIPVITQPPSALTGNTITSERPSQEVGGQSQIQGEQNQVQAPSANLETKRQESQEEILKRAADNAARLRSQTIPEQRKVLGFAQRKQEEELEVTNRTQAENLAKAQKQTQIDLQPLFTALKNKDAGQVNRELNQIAEKYLAKLEKIRDQEEFVLFANANKHDLEEDQILADNILGFCTNKKIGFVQTKPDLNAFHGVLFANEPEAQHLQKQLVQVSVQKFVLHRANASQKTLLQKLLNSSSKANVQKDNRSLLRQISENIGSIIQNFLKGLLRFTEVLKGGEQAKAV